MINFNMRHALLAMLICCTLLVACNGDGPNDPVLTSQLLVPNGTLYKGVMSGGSLSPLLEFEARSSDGKPLPDELIQLSVVVGDGELSGHSVLTNSWGKAAISYDFSGDLGYAVIEASAFDGQASQLVTLRADAVIPGVIGQGQYVLLGDTYSMVEALNGTTDSGSMRPGDTLVTVYFDDTIGLSVSFWDVAGIGVLSDSSLVQQITLSTGYDGTTIAGVGIGSPLRDVRVAHGIPDTISPGLLTVWVHYDNFGIMYECSDDLDTTVIGIRLFYPLITERPKLLLATGPYYKGTMGDTLLDPPLTLVVLDTNGSGMPDQQIQLHPVEGDGELATRSVTTDASGEATVGYNFNGSMGHAVIMATAIDDKDTVEAYLRANTLIPGVQGQYIKLDDLYQDVLELNGQPASVDTYPDHTIIYINYESALGVVVMLQDTTGTQQTTPDMPVYGVIVNSIYDKTTSEGIGIGSSMDDLRVAYGIPDTIYIDAGDINVSYFGQGMTYWCTNNADTTIEEMHLFPPQVEGTSPRTTHHKRRQ